MRSGSRVLVPVDSTTHQGSISHVATFPTAPGARRIQGWRNGLQFVADSGMGNVASVVRLTPTRERLFHSGAKIAFTRFESSIRSGEKHGTRILEVQPDALLVWGRPVGQPVGVYRVDEKACTLICEMEILSRVTRTPFGALVLGIQKEASVWQRTLVTPFDVTTVAHTARIAMLPGPEVLVAESIPFTGKDHRSTYHYRHTPEGIKGWQQLHLCKGEVAAGIVRTNEGILIGVRSKTHSRIVTAEGWPVHTMEGALLQMWQSPTSQTYAALVETHRRGVVMRQIWLGDQVVYEGQFALSQSDPTWSSNGAHIALRVKQNQQEQVVTDSGVVMLPKDEHAEEFLVDDDGFLTALIARTPHGFVATIHGRKHDTSRYAWNLRRGSDGRIHYYSVQHSSVLHMTDRPSLRRWG